MPSDRFVTIRRLHDPVQAQMWKDLLEQEGIRVASPGLNHRSLFGIAGSFVDVSLQVPEDQAERARELLEAMESSVSEVIDVDEVDSAGESRTTSEPVRDTDSPRGEGLGRDLRQKRVAAFAALALPFGGGHFYARSYPRAWTLLLGQCAVMYLGSHVDQATWAVAPGLVAVDLLGALPAVDVYNRGHAPSRVHAPDRGRAPKGWLSVVGRLLPWWTPVLVALPLVLRLYAPGFYVGGSGRALCESAVRCGIVDSASACHAGLAHRLAKATSSRKDVAFCAGCVTDVRCERLDGCWTPLCRGLAVRQSGVLDPTPL